jgi:hypothetical protein
MDKDSKSQQLRQEKTQQNKYWLQSKVNDILEPMMLACCQADPEDKVILIFKFLDQIHA